MVQIQLWTAARPGEILSMRGCDLDMTCPVWQYTPDRHKTEHHDKTRLILIGPRAQDIIRPFLKTDLMACLFSPRDAVGERKGKRQPGERYTVHSYHHAVLKGCERAFGMPEHLRRISTRVDDAERKRLLAEVAVWRAEHCWHPHQLRHTALTAIRREFGVEAARTVGGHANISTTELYAEADFDKARAIMKRIG